MVTKIKSKWVSGNLEFKESVSGNGGKIEFHGDIIQKGPASGFWAVTPDLAYPDPSKTFTWFEDFVGHVLMPVATGSAGGLGPHLAQFQYPVDFAAHQRAVQAEATFK